MLSQFRFVSPSIATTSRRNAGTLRCQAQVGDKFLPFIRSPGDILLLGPRVALGAALSISQNLEQLPSDLERVSILIQDPRPIEAKQNEVLLEIENRITTFMEKGLVAENDVINAVSDIIPEDVKASLPEELRMAVLTPRDIPSSSSSSSTSSSPYDPSSWSNGSTLGQDAKPLATWTISSMDEDDGGSMRFGSPTGNTNSTVGSSGVEIDISEPPATAANVAASQAAAELVEIQTAVLAVRDALTAVQENKDDSQTSMLKLNLREAAAGLSQRLNQRVSGPLTDADVAGALEEAQVLLSEVENLMMSL